MTESNPHGVRVGQIWSDNDMRNQGRRVQVLSIEGEYAHCEIVGNDAVTQEILNNRNDGPGRGGVTDRRGKKTRILLRRFKPNSTGYALVKDVT